MSNDFDDAMRRLGEAAAEAAVAFGKLWRALSDSVSAVLSAEDWPELLASALAKRALAEAPPRVRHLAYHSKKRRVRKKNINRALRDYGRSNRNGKG